MPHKARTLLFRTWFLAALWPVLLSAAFITHDLLEAGAFARQERLFSLIRYEITPKLTLVIAVALAALLPGITHAVALSRLKERRAPLFMASLLTFLIGVACELTVLAAAWVASLFITVYTQAWILDVIRAVGGLACYVIYILLPLRTVPLVESLLLHRSLRRRFPKNDAPDVRCSECGTVCRVGRVGLPDRFRYRTQTTAAVFALLLILLIGVPLASVSLSGSAGHASSHPTAVRHITHQFTPDDVRNTPVGDKLDELAAASSHPFALPSPGQPFNGRIILAVQDYTDGYCQDYQPAGVPIQWIQVYTYQFYSDPLTRTGPLPYSLAYAPYPGWMGHDGWRLRDGWRNTVLLCQTTTATGGKRVLLIELLGLIASIGLALAILHALLLAAWCWRRLGLGRWKRLERAAHMQCTECGYPLALPEPPTP